MEVFLTAKEAHTLWTCLKELARNHRDDIVGVLTRFNSGQISPAALNDKLVQLADAQDIELLCGYICQRFTEVEEIHLPDLLKELDCQPFVLRAEAAVLACDRLVKESKISRVFQVRREGKVLGEYDSFMDIPDLIDDKPVVRDQIRVLFRRI